MCGRFGQYTPIEELRRFFRIDTVTCEAEPRYNIPPGTDILAIIRKGENHRLGKLRWGLVPGWSEDPSIGNRLINARFETAAEKPAFKDAFRSRRCLIPADGFYEWEPRKSGTKQPWYFTLPSKEPFGFAGLWETWRDREGNRLNTCVILTADASPSVAKVHDRMPILLEPQYREGWLDSEEKDPNVLTDLLRNGRIRELRGYPVSDRVNSPRKDSPRLIEPL